MTDMTDEPQAPDDRPRCDGVYACPTLGANGDHGWSYLRFHPDARVTAAWARTEPDVIGPQLTPDREDLDQGYLRVDGRVFGFSTVSRQGQGDWAGFVRSDGTLFVRSVSQIDGRTTDETYSFHRLG
jgi:hypothetical protein